MVALTLLTLAAGALASPALHNNLAYRSPSLNIPGIGHNVEAIKSRLGKRADSYWTGEIEFRYGVASGDPYSDSVRPDDHRAKLIARRSSCGPTRATWIPKASTVLPAASLSSSKCVLFARALADPRQYIVSTSPTDFNVNTSVWNGVVQVRRTSA